MASIHKNRSWYFTIQITLDILKPFQSIRLLRQGQARASFTPPQSYTKPLPITEKKKDLLSLLQFIPVIFHDYYKNLLTNKNERDVLIDLADE